MKLLSSALQLSPAIEILLGPQLQRFGLTWEILNKHLYQSLVYSHYDVQENLPRFIGQVSLKIFVFKKFNQIDYCYKKFFLASYNVTIKG